MNFTKTLKTAVATALIAAMPALSHAKTEAKPDSDMKKVLDELALKGGKPIETLSVQDARKQPTPADAVKSLMSKGQEKKTDKGFAKVEDKNIKGAAGEISARFYTPDGKLPMPVVVYFHGGGWVIADKNVYDGSARAIAI
ncbi:MAG: lipase, partial [Proteobacteria bacterium]